MKTRILIRLILGLGFTASTTAHAIDRRSILKMFGLSAGSVLSPRIPTAAAHAVNPASMIATVTVESPATALRSVEIFRLYKDRSPHASSLDFFEGDGFVVRTDHQLSSSPIMIQKAREYVAASRRDIELMSEGKWAQTRVHANFGPLDLTESGMSTSEVQEEIGRRLLNVERSLGKRYGLDESEIYLRVRALLDPSWVLENALRGHLPRIAPYLDLNDAFVRDYLFSLNEVSPDTARITAGRYYNTLRLGATMLSDTLREHVNLKTIPLTRFYEAMEREGLNDLDDIFTYEFVNRRLVAWNRGGYDCAGWLGPRENKPEAIISTYLDVIGRLDQAIADLRVLPNSPLGLTMLSTIESLRSTIDREYREFPKRFHNLALVCATQQEIDRHRSISRAPEETAAIRAHTLLTSAEFTMRWNAALSAMLQSTALPSIDPVAGEPKQIDSANEECGAALSSAPVMLEHQPADVLMKPRNGEEIPIERTAI